MKTGNQPAAYTLSYKQTESCRLLFELLEQWPPQGDPGVVLRGHPQTFAINGAYTQRLNAVFIGGYGRVGHTVAVLLQASGVPFIAFDSDAQRVAKGRADGHQVLYGDIADLELLAAVHVERAALVVITVDNPATALRAVTYMRSNCPHVPVIARARDLESSSRLLVTGATHACPETQEASMRLGATALQMLHIPTGDIDVLIQGVRDGGYIPIAEAEQKRTGSGILAAQAAQCAQISDASKCHKTHGNTRARQHAGLPEQ